MLPRVAGPKRTGAIHGSCSPVGWPTVSCPFSFVIQDTKRNIDCVWRPIRRRRSEDSKRRMSLNGNEVFVWKCR